MKKQNNTTVLILKIIFMFIIVVGFIICIIKEGRTPIASDFELLLFNILIILGIVILLGFILKELINILQDIKINKKTKE